MDEEKLIGIMVDHEDRLFKVEHSLKDDYMTKQTGSEIMLLLDRVAGDYKKINEELVHFGENFRRFEIQVNSRFDKLESRFDILESRFDKLESRFGTLETRMGGVETRLASVENYVKK